MKRTAFWGVRLYLLTGTSLGLGFALMAVTVIVALSAGVCSSQGIGVNAAPGPSVVQAKVTTKVGPIPGNYKRLYKKVGNEWNIPWQYLAGIGWVETHHGTLTGTPGVHSGENYAGAGGPMQFLESSWALFEVDGDGDGKANRYDPADAIAGAANHLRSTVGKKDPSVPLSQSDILEAIHRYNPGNYDSPLENPYVEKVLAATKVYFDDPAVAPANFAGGACPSIVGASLAGSGSFGQRIAHAAAYYAMKEAGTPTPPERFKGDPIPYSWGGGTLHGPDPGICCSPSGRDARKVSGFDCSGLVLYAVYQASNGEIVMPRTTWAQEKSDKGVPASGKQLTPGDLIFSHNDSHVSIYYGLFNGQRWVVEAAGGDPVQFNVYDSSTFSGALRVTPPSGMGGAPPDIVRAMAPSGAGVGEGAM